MGTNVLSAAEYIDGSINAVDTNIQLVSTGAAEDATVNLDITNQSANPAAVTVYAGASATTATVLEPGTPLGPAKTITRTGIVLGNSHSIWFKSDIIGVNAVVTGYVEDV